MKRTAFLQHVVRQLRETAEARQRGRASDAELLRRFQTDGDPEAFEAIVRRYGACVLAACRKVLPSEADAEDAFQATFLALLQNAHAVRHPQLLRGWLSGVAHRVAWKALAASARHRGAQQRKPPAAEAAPDLSWREACAILHEELDRLPDKYRLPLILCYLEGKSRDEAAQQLGVEAAVLHGRLQRGRDRLRGRLLRRGVALTAGLLAVVANSVPAGGPPENLVRATLTAAATGNIPAAVAALVHGASPPMTIGKMKLAAAALLAVSLLVGGVGLHMHGASAQPKTETKSLAVVSPDRATAPTEGLPELVETGPQPVAATSAEPPADEKDSIAYSGRVLGADGKPVAGAKLYLTHAVGSFRRLPPPAESATTGDDGRFEFTAPRAKFGDRYTVVAAAAPNHGAGWVNVSAGGRRDDLTVRLAADDAPITGQIVDLEGKPVAGATLTLFQIQGAPGDDLGPWLEAVKGKKGLSYELENQYLTRYTVALSQRVTTDAEGRLRLAGIGRNRLVRAQLDGPTIASENLLILTRPGKPFEVTEFEGKPEYGDPRRVVVYYGSDFRHAAAPTKPVVGVVRDKDTKKPLAGVTVQSYKMANNPIHGVDLVKTTTDDQGRYRLTGMPRGEGGKVMIVPPDDQPYVAAHAEVPDTPGFDPVTVDFELKRGVWIEGKITDKLTGKPLRGSVQYYAMAANPNLRDHPGFSGTDNHTVAAKADGSYRVAGLPGPGLLAVYYQRDNYLRANVRDDEFGAKEDTDHPLETAPFILFFTSNYSAIARFDAAKGVDVVKRDITLDPGWMFTGKVLGPDGKPLTGVRGFGLASWDWWLSDDEELSKGEFTVRGFDPQKPRDVLFMHREKGLVGATRPPTVKGQPVTVRMEPGAAVAGRLVDADGKPRAGVDLEVSFRTKDRKHWCEYLPERVRTDAEGRFRVRALLPGYEYRLSDGKGERPFGDGLRADQTKDLGDMRLKRADE
jgi:RNA polymerase sigma factor (sigma-70 family)